MLGLKFPLSPVSSWWRLLRTHPIGVFTQVLSSRPHGARVARSSGQVPSYMKEQDPDSQAWTVYHWLILLHLRLVEQPYFAHTC